MKFPYISELQPNQVATTTLLVHIKDVRQKRTGEPYLSLILGDRTGELEAKMWDNVAEVMDTFDRDDFVRVKGLLQIYQNKPQLTIHKVLKVREAEVDFADYFPASVRDTSEMFVELQAIVAGIGNPHLRALLELFLADQPLMKLFRTAPAAKNVHHAFLGGLLEHVLSMCALCRMTAAHYRFVDSDLLLAGAILHDIGKVAELTYERSFGYSVEGQLLGHIVIGLRMLGDKLNALPSFPPRLRALLEHLIVSHHGELEYGSPKTPLFPEALLLHHIDNLDSKMECMRALLAKDKLADSCWTVYNSTLDRSVLKTAKYLDGGIDLAVAPAAVVEPEPEPVMIEHEPVIEPDSAPSAPVRPEHPVSMFAEKLQQAWRK